MMLLDGPTRHTYPDAYNWRTSRLGLTLYEYHLLCERCGREQVSLFEREVQSLEDVACGWQCWEQRPQPAPPSGQGVLL